MISSSRRRRRSRIRSSVIARFGASPRQNFETFVEAGRLAPAMGDCPFDDRIWIVPTRANDSGGKGLGELAFTVRSTSEDPAAPALEKNFGDLLKSIIRLDDARKPSQISGYRRMISAARILHQASEDVGHDPCLLTTSHFKRALRIAQTSRKEVSGIYEAGRFLEKFADILNDAGIPALPIHFKNTAERPLERTRGHVDLEGSREVEDARMPNEGALAALARASQLVTTPQDVMLMRIVELLPCAPWRINDILRLPFDCEVEEPVTRNGKPVLDADGRQAVRYGIRYRGSKGFLADIKWIPSAMVDVARRAIGQIKQLSAEAREIAKFMEDNPGRAWLTEPWRLSNPDRILTGEELRDAVGFHGFKNLSTFVHSFGIPRTACSTQRKWRYRLGDVEQALLGASRAIRGDFVMKRSEYLLIVPRNFFGVRGVVPAVIDLVHYSAVKNFLCSRYGCKSVFERFDLRDANGQFHVLKTHQVRHYVNTIAAEGGLGELELARWSGRTDAKTNDAYDHQPAYELARKARALLEAGRMMGPTARTWERKPPMERSEFSLVHLATVHTTDIGLCFHDWGTAPCPHHGACADCHDCAIIKGDPVHRSRIELLLSDVEFSLAHAIAEVGDGTHGASNYVEHHRRMVFGYRRMLAVHDDPEIEDGTIVQMEPEPAREGLLEMAHPV